MRLARRAWAGAGMGAVVLAGLLGCGAEPMTPVAAPAALLPRLLSDAAPRYPLTARNRRIEGSVQVAFTILPDGRVGNARLLSAQPAGVFDEAVLSAVARWRFEATGRSVSTHRTLTFALPDS